MERYDFIEWLTYDGVTLAKICWDRWELRKVYIFID